MAVIDRRCNAIEELSHDSSLLLSPIGRRFPGISHSMRELRVDAPPQRVDIAIIGGGAIGCGIACELRQSAQLRDRVIILDADTHLLQRYFAAMLSAGQRVMRSPYEHQLAPDGTIQMLDFARLHAGLLTPLERGQVRLGLSGQRAVVPLDIFVAHSTHVLAVHRLREIAYRFAVAGLRRTRDGLWAISDAQGRTVHARAVVLAAGNRQTPWPAELDEAGQRFPDRVQPVYAGARHVAPGEHVLIVGSGLSAGHCILQCVEAGAVPIWAVRDEERYRCADFPTSYFRTEGVAAFRRLPLEQKLDVLRDTHRGSLMLEFLPLIQEYEASGRMRILRGATVAHIGAEGGRLRATMSSGEAFGVDRVVVAIGLTPNTALLPREMALVGGRYPLVSPETLEVQGHEQLFAAGSLGVLHLGPAGKNIDGARLAAELILPALEERFGAAAPAARPRLANRITGSASIQPPIFEGRHVTAG
ncbi:MAG TPA: FAD-dependent oxidoreductase [Roseiflexaceae bacterium]|nr:FAD-dependent oxidoreductase [Roseiflexaceae bacterium]